MKKTAKIEPDGNSLLLRAFRQAAFRGLMEQPTASKTKKAVSLPPASCYMHGFENRHDLEGKTDLISSLMSMLNKYSTMSISRRKLPYSTRSKKKLGLTAQPLGSLRIKRYLPKFR